MPTNLTIKPAKFRPKPPAWAANPGACDPRYKFQWVGAKILLPLLDNHTEGFTGVNRVTTYDFGSGQTWSIENTSLKGIIDEIGWSLEWTANNSEHDLFTAESATHFDIAANKPFTIALVMKFDSAGDLQQFIRAASGANFLILNSSDQLWARLDGNDAPAASAATAVTVDEWQTVVLSYDGTTARLYLDGQLIGTTATTSAAWTNLEFFGARFTNQVLQGGMSYYSVHDQAWGQGEIDLFQQDPWGGFRMDDITPAMLNSDPAAGGGDGSASAFVRGFPAGTYRSKPNPAEFRSFPLS